MSDIWVANASPVIVLGKIGQLPLLTQLCGELWLPIAVVEEVTAGPIDDPARIALQKGWGLRETSPSVNPGLLEWGLGPGETSVLALAMERAPAVAILDDAAARACAKVLGVPVIGTLGLILKAKRQRLLPTAAVVMKELRHVGLHLDDQVIRIALESVGETW